jgi:cob(I)alamin adenosyltransferase
MKPLKKPPKLYTKTGDKGESGLANGVRLSKASLIFEVLGTLDELNAHLGMAVVAADKATKLELMRLQDTLLIIGAQIAGSTKVALEPSEISWMEERIDVYQQQTRSDWYTKFLLPGGTELAARLDVARTVCRRAERLVARHSEASDVSANISMLINRLSDYLFALRCYVNAVAGFEEKEFSPRYLQSFERIKK